MTIAAARTLGAERLLTVVLDQNVARFEVDLMLCHITHHPKTWLIAHSQKKQLTVGQRQRFETYLKRRKQHEPLAYLLGSWSFYGHEFRVDHRVLIPRPESELLVDQVRSMLQASPRDQVIWDVGTGSGTLAISLALALPTTPVIASDIQPASLQLAKRNARRLLPKTARIAFITADLLDHRIKKYLDGSSAKQIIVVANLPYLPISDKKILAPEVVRFEPSAALFTRQGGLFLIHKLLKQLAIWHKQDKRPLTVLAEFDPPQAARLTALSRQLFPAATVTIQQDLCGRDRILRIQTV